MKTSAILLVFSLSILLLSCDEQVDMDKQIQSNENVENNDSGINTEISWQVKTCLKGRFIRPWATYLIHSSCPTPAQFTKFGKAWGKLRGRQKTITNIKKLAKQAGCTQIINKRNCKPINQSHKFLTKSQKRPPINAVFLELYCHQNPS